VVDPPSSSTPQPADRVRARSAESLLPLVYEELRAAAARLMRKERSDHTLQRTALVHEAYAKLVGAGARFESELHFFYSAAQAMRRILVDHALSRGARKRGGGRARINFDDVDFAQEDQADPMDWQALDETLDRLAKVAPRRAQIVHLKYFAGLTDAEIGKLLGISASPVRREWATARAWLYQQMKDKLARI
jgi:RNA polymerase sigma factor (TIGR02999 family)